MSSLSSSPLLPEEGVHDPPPKTYAEAAKQGADGTSESQQQVNGTYGLNLQGTSDTGANGSRTPDQDTGSGQNDTPKSPIQKDHMKESSFESNSSKTKTNEGNGNNVVFEKYQGANGKQLASIKSSDDYEKELRQDGKERPSELVSGRRAGEGWEKSSIRWAPLNVPLKRRLQTFVVLLHTLSIATTLTIFFFLCAIPLLWPILLPYLIFVLLSDASTNGKLAYRSERFRRSPVWSLFASYFPARLHRSQELPPTRKYIFGYHPHGIISHGAFAAFATEALGFSQLFPGITNTLLTLDSNFRIPLYRDYALRMGLASVSRESCSNLLSKGGPNGEGMGRAITIVVGGARESLNCHPGTMQLVLNHRKGFVKMAIKTGADLVPVLAFGENEIYEQVDPQSHPRIHKVQLLVKKIAGFTVPLFHARGIFNYDVGMMPYRRPINVVVGRPIMIIKQDRPSPEYVDEVHANYIEELTRIWDEWKDTFAKDRKGGLEIVD